MAHHAFTSAGSSLGICLALLLANPACQSSTENDEGPAGGAGAQQKERDDGVGGQSDADTQRDDTGGEEAVGTEEQGGASLGEGGNVNAPMGGKDSGGAPSGGGSDSGAGGCVVPTIPPQTFCYVEADCPAGTFCDVACEPSGYACVNGVLMRTSDCRRVCRASGNTETP
jgi:hypothetical protein